MLFINKLQKQKHTKRLKEERKDYKELYQESI